jgi:Mg-chelatase subunit ChlD
MMPTPTNDQTSAPDAAPVPPDVKYDDGAYDDPTQERLYRWRLILGGGTSDGINCKLPQGYGGMDKALGELYGNQDDDAAKKSKRGGSEASMPNVSRWLGDIRDYFPASVVEIMQHDAIERIGLRKLLSAPDFLEIVQPDVQLVATLLSLKGVVPNETKATARLVVKKVVDDLIKKLQNPTQQAIRGALNRAIRNNRPRHNEIDWNRTIRANLKHYQPAYRTVIPERRIGYGRKHRSSLRDVILCVDQSGSMASSVVYSSIFGAVMASLPALKTHMVVFDTAVVDLTADLHDPVDLLFGTQLGGGTDINQALAYCQQLIRRPRETILVLISDLYEGGQAEQMLDRVAQISAAGVQMVSLLALNDRGAAAYDHHMASEYAARGVPAFACTPDLFPDLMATVINKQGIAAWAAKHDIQLPRAGG